MTKKMTEVDVVIISWAKTPELRAVTQNCLDTLYASEVNVRFNPIIVETDKDTEYNWGVTIHPKSKFGYNKYCNLGRKKGKAPHVVLCNNDILFDAGWATCLLAARKQFPRFRSMSPWCPRTHGDVNGKRGQLIEGYQARREISGWCIFQDRTIYDTIGDLDEELVFWYVDNDYGATLMKHGIKHCLVPDSMVTHLGSEKATGLTTRTLDEKTQEKYRFGNEEYIKEKWGDMETKSN